ncbi:MAG: hypothetical protein ISS92_00750 [Candidatus Omnitrophica bacterium]|nr:hypothetical protein [Candidatus Omnitrophota bacterium]
MVDKKLEENIKKTKEFIEIWNKFHRIFKNAISENHLTEGKEKEFLSIKSLVNSRYEDLMDSLEVKPLGRFIISPFVYNVLSLEKLSIMSDEKLKIVDKDWKESSKFLDSLFNRLERKKRRIEGFNRFFFVLKKGITKLR